MVSGRVNDQVRRATHSTASEATGPSCVAPYKSQNSAVWDDVWPQFCEHFHTIRYDRRGYGHSPAATTWYSETNDLEALLGHLKVVHAVLVGSSYGGELSIDFALDHPNVVQRLVLVGAVVSGMPYSRH